jgi:hypothetical protein
MSDLPQLPELQKPSLGQKVMAFVQRQNTWLWVALGILVLAVAGAFTWWSITKPSSSQKAPNLKGVPATSSPTPTVAPSPTPNPNISLLTGATVSADQAKRPIIAVMVENHPDARPQSGLQSAGVVYEALAEGGITRFQAYFQDTAAPTIGPVRSLRPYYIDWALEYGAPVAHAGGSADALNLIGPTGLKALNALVIGAPTFYRTNDRVAPHNLYTNSSLLDKLLAAKGWAKAPSFSPNARTADAPSSTPAHPNIHIEYSSAGYAVDYKYEAASNSYSRYLAGKAHTDRNNGQIIKVKNVVVLYTGTTNLNDGYGHVKLDTIGKGNALVFRDGTATTGTWSKDSRTSRTKLLDGGGKEIPLTVGNTWYSIVPTTKPVTY